MIFKYTLRLIFVAILLSIAACTSQPVEPQYSVYKLEEEATTAYKNKNWKLAEEKLSLLISVAPGTADTWFLLGDLYSRTSRPDKAIAAYKEAVLRRPSFEKAWRHLGVVSLTKSAHLYIEMLQNVDKNSVTYIHAKKTSEVLLKLIKKNQQINGLKSKEKASLK